MDVIYGACESFINIFDDMLFDMDEGEKKVNLVFGKFHDCDYQEWHVEKLYIAIREFNTLHWGRWYAVTSQGNKFNTVIIYTMAVLAKDKGALNDVYKSDLDLYNKMKERGFFE